MPVILKTIVFRTADSGQSQSALIRAFAEAAGRSGKSGPVAVVGGPPPEAGVSTAWSWRSGDDFDIEGVLAGLETEGHGLVLFDLPPIDGNFGFADLIVVPVQPNPDTVGAVGSVLGGMEGQSVPFVFVIHGADPESDTVGAVVMALAQYGTICPVIIPRIAESCRRDQSEGDPVARALDYLLARMDRLTRRAAALTPVAPDERRQFPRWSCDLPAVLVHDGTRSPCRIVDIGGGGMAVTCDFAAPEGACITIEAENLGAVTGEVRYVNGERMGLMFTMDASAQTDLCFRMANAIAHSSARRSRAS
ncbi:MAG: PilZ domain-containing protein [Alphaproteobacteria bacterium]